MPLATNYSIRLQTGTVGELHRTLGELLERGDAEPNAPVLTEVGIGGSQYVGALTMSVRAEWRGRVIISADTTEAR